jgi:hypothetical protein
MNGLGAGKFTLGGSADNSESPRKLCDRRQSDGIPEMTPNDAGKETEPPRVDVPRYYRVACRFHDDEKVRLWPDWVKLLALYLLTTKHRNLEGFFVLPPDYVAADLSWTRNRVVKGLDILQDEGFLSFDSTTNLILVRNALKYQQPDSRNVQKAVLGRIRILPENQKLLQDFIDLATEHCRKIGLSPWAQGFPELLRKEFRPQQKL